MTSLSVFTFMHWRRKWQPTPVFLPGESQGRGSLVGCRLWDCTESDTTEATLQQQQALILQCFHPVIKMDSELSTREGTGYPLQYSCASLVAQLVKNPPAMRETWVQSLGWEDLLKKKWQPTPIFLPGKFHGQRSVVGYSPWGWKELAMTE